MEMKELVNKRTIRWYLARMVVVFFYSVEYSTRAFAGYRVSLDFLQRAAVRGSLS